MVLSTSILRVSQMWSRGLPYLFVFPDGTSSIVVCSILTMLFLTSRASFCQVIPLSVLLVAFGNKVKKVWTTIIEWSMKCYQCIRRRSEKGDVINHEVPSSIDVTAVSIPPSPLVMIASNSQGEKIYEVHPFHRGKFLSSKNIKEGVRLLFHFLSIHEILSMFLL